MARGTKGVGLARRILASLGVVMLLVTTLGCDTTSSSRREFGERPTASAVHDPVLYDIPKPGRFPFGRGP